MDGAHCHITNSLNMPAEAVEHEYPLMVEEYALVVDSGGAGRHRGGMGVARDVRILEDGTTFSGRADSYITAAEGYDGGKPGGNCRIVRNHGTNREEKMSPKQKLLTLEADGLTLAYKGAGKGDADAATCRADHAIDPSLGLYYYEVTILDRGAEGKAN